LADAAEILVHSDQKNHGVGPGFIRFSSFKFKHRQIVMTTQTVSPSDKLKFRYIAAYLVEGLQAPSDGTRLIYLDDISGKKAYLTDHSDEIWKHTDTVQTIAHITLSMMFQGKTWDLTQFREHVSATAQERIQRYGTTSAFLILEACHDEEASRIGQIGESAERDFCLSLTGGFRDEVEERHETFLQQAQSFLYFAMPNVSGLRLVGSCIAADHPSGKPLYVLTSSMSVRPTLSHPLPTAPEDGPELLTGLFERAPDLEVFQSTFRLFAGSATNVRDNLRAFLFAFTALEAFLSRFFKRHKQTLFEHRRLTLSSEIQDYIEDIEERRKDQGRSEEDFPIAYKFALISSFLMLDKLAETVDDFDEATRQRNAVAHGLDFDEAKLPTGKVWTLLGRIVRGFIAHKGGSTK
jgi:hypothetical protein